MNQIVIWSPKRENHRSKVTSQEDLKVGTMTDTDMTNTVDSKWLNALLMNF